MVRFVIGVLYIAIWTFWVLQVGTVCQPCNTLMPDFVVGCNKLVHKKSTPMSIFFLLTIASTCRTGPTFVQRTLARCKGCANLKVESHCSGVQLFCTLPTCKLAYSLQRVCKVPALPDPKSLGRLHL